MRNIKDKIIEILNRDISDWFVAESLLPIQQRTKEELFNYLADQLLELFIQQKQEIVEEIDKVYRKEEGIHHWLDLREKLLKN